MSLELLYFGAVAARDIMSLDAAWKMEWRDWLDCMVRMILQTRVIWRDLNAAVAWDARRPLA